MRPLSSHPGPPAPSGGKNSNWRECTHISIMHFSRNEECYCCGGRMNKTQKGENSATSWMAGESAFCTHWGSHSHPWPQPPLLGKRCPHLHLHPDLSPESQRAFAVSMSTWKTPSYCKENMFKTKTSLKACPSPGGPHLRECHQSLKPDTWLA